MNISFDVPYFSFMLLILNECKETGLALGCLQLIITVLIQQQQSHLRDFLFRLPDLFNDFFTRLTTRYENVK
jgi:hypothetical protein